MGFFDYWFRKPGEEPQPEAAEDGPKPIYVPMSMLMRSVVYDAGFEEPENVMNSLGLPPVSAEVAEMEQAASDRRLDAIEPLAPFLAVSSHMLAKATVEYSMSQTLSEDMPDEMKDALRDQFQRLALGAAVCTISSLVDLGMVKLNGIALGVGQQPADLGDIDFGGLS